MAEQSDKRPKTEEPENTELINSLNEEAEERKAVKETNQGARGPDNGPPFPTPIGEDAKSVEDKDGATIVDDDSEPTLLQAESGTGKLFPGAPCTTVARRCKKGNEDTAPLFLNRYGPRAKGWFVWSTSPALGVGQKPEDLQNVSEKFHRVLDFPREQGKARYQASNVHGILNIVWDCEGLQDDPDEAAELLNPEKVKRADSLTTSKARRDWLKEEKHSLPKYPTTHMDVKFHQRINDATKSPVAESKGDLFTSWEVASQYKALYRKDQIKAEWRVYEAARQQAKRFNQWYSENHPQGFAEHQRSLSRDPTLQPFKRSENSPSPAYDDKSTKSPRVKSGSSTTELGSVPEHNEGNEKPALASKTQPDQTQKATESQPESKLDDGKLSRAELEEVVLEGWCAAKKIVPDRMSPKDRLKFSIYFDVYSKEY